MSGYENSPAYGGGHRPAWVYWVGAAVLAVIVVAAILIANALPS